MENTIYAATKRQMINDMEKSNDLLIGFMDKEDIQAFFKDLDVMCDFDSISGIHKNDDTYYTYKKSIAEGYKKDFGINFYPAEMDINGEIKEINQEMKGENIMKKTVIEQLEDILKKENGEITIGDTSEAVILKMFKEGNMSLENVLIGLYNMASINKSKIKNLETNLDMLTSRIYDTETDFTDEEKQEIQEGLNDISDDKLKNIENNKECLYDVLYCTETDFDVM